MPLNAVVHAGRSCAFCCAKTLAEKNTVVYKDARVFGIRDRNPRATHHFLVIPHEHIATVNDLTLEHHDLLSHMMETGRHLLAQEGLTSRADYQLGFHRPPFASVKHLHLHCLGYPFVPSWNRFRFTESFLHSYVDAERVLASLTPPVDR